MVLQPVNSYRMEFFKVYIVKDDLVRIWERDCFKLTDKYAYVRALRCSGTWYDWRVCLSMVSDKYFKTLDEAEQYICNERQKKIDKINSDIQELQKAIDYHKSKKKYYELKSDWDYDDRGAGYESVL